MHGRGCVWQGDVHGRWGGMCGRWRDMRDRWGHMHGRGCMVGGRGYVVGACMVGGGHAWHTVNERAVRILVECILVVHKILFAVEDPGVAGV